MWGTTAWVAFWLHLLEFFSEYTRLIIEGPIKSAPMADTMLVDPARQPLL
jgi:hypothetical protein